MHADGGQFVFKNGALASNSPSIIPGHVGANSLLLFDYLCKPLPRGCRLTAIMDCCHSGTAMDLPYVFVGTAQNMQGLFKADGSVNMNTIPQMIMSTKVSQDA